MDELTTFLKRLDLYVRHFPGSVQEAFVFQQDNSTHFLLEACPPHLLHHQNRGTYLFHIYQPLEYVYVLLEGNCCVEKLKQSGVVITDHTRHPIQMFGLFESIAGIQWHTATMRCATRCTFLKVPIAQYLRTVRSDPDLLWLTIQFLSSFMADYISASDLLILNSPKYQILSKVYKHCAGKTFPVTLPDTKEDLARDLNLNLRTMYRYLDRCYQEGMLSSVKGKITVSQKQYEEIARYLQNAE